MSKWDDRFMSIAFEVATWSKDPHKKVGALAVSPDGRKWSPGYNGFPAQMEDTPERLNNRELKNKYMVHAEANAIANSTAQVNDWTIYVTKAPCLPCAKLIAGARIARVVCPNPGGSWENEQLEAIAFLRLSEIEVSFYG